MYSQPHWSGSDCTVRVYDRQVCRHCLSHSLLRSLLLTSQQNVCYGYALRRRYTSKVIPGNIFRIRTHWRLVTKPHAASLRGACQAWVQRCDRWHHHNKSFTIKEAFAIRSFGTQMNLAMEKNHRLRPSSFKYSLRKCEMPVLFLQMLWVDGRKSSQSPFHLTNHSITCTVPMIHNSLLDRYKIRCYAHAMSSTRASTKFIQWVVVAVHSPRMSHPL